MTECEKLKLTKSEISGKWGKQEFKVQTCMGSPTLCQGRKVLCWRPMFFVPTKGDIKLQKGTPKKYEEDR